MDNEKFGRILGQIKDIVEKQAQERELFKEMIRACLIQKRKQETGGGYTIDEWTKYQAEAYYAAGLGPKPYHVALRERHERWKENRNA